MDSSEDRWKTSKIAGGLRAVGQSLSDSGREMTDSASSRGITPVAYRKGGKVRKTGIALVHRGERVIPASKRKKVERLMKRAKMRKTNRSRR